MYSQVNFKDSRFKTSIHGNNIIRDYIRDNNLQKIPHDEFDYNLYPYYNDGTAYYKNNKNQIIRTTLEEVYLCNNGKFIKLV